MKDGIAKYYLVLLLLHPILLLSQHQSQYPDTIVEAYNTLTKTSDQFFGGVPFKYGWLVSIHSLTHKNDTFVSLPTGSYVVLGFTDNYIIDAPDQADIYLEEVAGAGEYADVLVSSDNKTYTLLGVAGNGQVNKFDLATIAYSEPVSFIKVIGKDAKGQSPGFDLRNVYGLPGSNRPVAEKPIILENVVFQTNRSDLMPASLASLDKLVNELQDHSAMKIEIRGHTDSIGRADVNLVLSEQRANAVMEYLVSKGIEQTRLSSKGFGSSSPIASNGSEEGRKKNRRVEFVKVE